VSGAGKSGAEIFDEIVGQAQRNGRGPTPTHDELRDAWIEFNPGYAYGLGEWRHYKGGVWQRTAELAIKQQISEILERAKAFGVRPSSALLASVTELAKVKVAIPDEAWDANPDLLVCENGTLRIPTRELTGHRPEHYVTSAVPYAYDPKARPGWWPAFLNDTVPDAAPFLQEFGGYALTTDTSLETALWLSGPPGSGRSTFLAGLQAMLGNRAGVLGLAEIERNRFALSNLAGKTLVMATEQPSAYLASTNVINAIISGEPLQVERKYRDPYDLIPHAKIAWAMNELPRVADANSGLFRRVKVVKFPQIPEHQRDPAVKRQIQTEGAGILNWALEGLERLQKRGHFEVPSSVEDATQHFQSANDVPATFLEEACIREDGAKMTGAQLYATYKFWCEENGHRPQSSTRVADDWQRLGLERRRPKGVTHYYGVREKLPSERRGE
jgi:P4 family phage/plasmid primase-like protien